MTTEFTDHTDQKRCQKRAPSLICIFTPVAEIPFAGHPTLGTAWPTTPERGKNSAGELVNRKQ